MKAIRVHNFGGPDVLKLESLADLKAGPGEVLVRVKAIGVNPVDTYIRSGIYGERLFPYTPGMDAAGEVEAVGPDVYTVKSGDRVYVYGSQSGTYADKVLCKSAHVHPLPTNISFAQGAALGVAYVTAYYALVHRAQARPGENVLIHGASGGVGTAAVQIARHLGLTVIGSAGSEKGRALVQKEGAHHVLDHKKPGYLDEVMKLTQGKGVDIIIEMLANENLGKDLKILARHGRVIVVGSRGSVSVDPRDTMSRNGDIRGMSILTLSENELSSFHQKIEDGLRAGWIRPIVGSEMALGEASKAHERVMSSGAFGKIVLIP